MKRTTIFCVMGKSASGKNTVLEAILNKNTKISYLVPITTRPMRANEANGKDYFFISYEQFISMKNKGKLMEHRKYDVINSEGNQDTWYYGNIYPSSKAAIMIGTPESYRLLKLNKSIDVLPIYIKVSEEERLYRCIRRESYNSMPNYREVARRYLKDESELSDSVLEELGITNEHTYINKDINDVSNEINNVINKYLNEVTDNGSM